MIKIKLLLNLIAGLFFLIGVLISLKNKNNKSLVNVSVASAFIVLIYLAIFDILPECLETTSLGVAYLAGLGSGYFKDLDDIKKIHKISKEFYPLMEESERAEIDKKWAKAIEATRVFK